MNFFFCCGIFTLWLALMFILNELTTIRKALTYIAREIKKKGGES